MGAIACFRSVTCCSNAMRIMCISESARSTFPLRGRLRLPHGWWWPRPLGLRRARAHAGERRGCSPRRTAPRSRSRRQREQRRRRCRRHCLLVCQVGKAGAGQGPDLRFEGIGLARELLRGGHVLADRRSDAVFRELGVPDRPRAGHLAEGRHVTGHAVPFHEALLLPQLFKGVDLQKGRDRAAVPGRVHGARGEGHLCRWHGRPRTLLVTRQ